MSFWRKVHCWASRSFANLRDLRVICGWCVTSRYLTPRLGRCGVQWLRSVLKWNFNVYRCTEYRILYEMIWNEYVTWILSSWHKIGLLRKNLDVQENWKNTAVSEVPNISSSTDSNLLFRLSSCWSSQSWNFGVVRRRKQPQPWLYIDILYIHLHMCVCIKYLLYIVYIILDIYIYHIV
jgi:hypothetical protein